MPALADASEGAAQRLQEPLAARITHAVKAGELPAHLDAEHEAQHCISATLAELPYRTVVRRVRPTPYRSRLGDPRLA